ncbi:hypothetical protein POL68_36170 [Stigmatella sp. ncwal1]|uniref:Uncharacterized protein n=1 Tax=Stigmatella ashevillensis TaxID=2995309 RepID=A0ABT5DK47_9BACT|nr:hypothetical protein [Stigmatella ashevillena]MDC0713959.1 hypothetical protein [Stigmatella ashevillena]
MSSIRRILSGISSTAWATRYEALAPIRQAPPAPVAPVQRGFSGQSDFQSAQEVERSPLSAHAPGLAGQPRNADMLRGYAGLSDFQAALPRYQHLLGTNIPPPPGSHSWGMPGSRSSAAQASLEPSRGNASAPGLTAPADLEKSAQLAGEEDSVLLYTSEGDAPGRSVVQHADGRVTDPSAPETPFPDAAAWEQANPGLTRALSLSRSDADLVLDMPEGTARDEILSELASTFNPSDSAATTGDGFMPSFDDVPTHTEPSADEATADAFMPSLDDLPGARQAADAPLASTDEVLPLSAEEFAGLLSPTGALAEGKDPMEAARQVSSRGTAGQQTQLAMALYEQGQTPGPGEAPPFQRAAALTASAHPEATQALLQQIGEPRLADFVRSVMQA